MICPRCGHGMNYILYGMFGNIHMLHCSKCNFITGDKK